MNLTVRCVPLLTLCYTITWSCHVCSPPTQLVQCALATLHMSVSPRENWSWKLLDPEKWEWERLEIFYWNTEDGVKTGSGDPNRRAGYNYLATFPETRPGLEVGSGQQEEILKRKYLVSKSQSVYWVGCSQSRPLWAGIVLKHVTNHVFWERDYGLSLTRIMISLFAWQSRWLLDPSTNLLALLKSILTSPTLL